MENDTGSIEALLEKTVDYGKTSLELVKLKVLDKISDIISSLLPRVFAIFSVATFFLFINFGLGFWLSKILNNTFLGFFVVAGFYGILAIFVRFLMYNRIKRLIYNFMIKQVTK